MKLIPVVGCDRHNQLLTLPDTHGWVVHLAAPFYSEIKCPVEWRLDNPIEIKQKCVKNTVLVLECIKWSAVYSSHSRTFYQMPRCKARNTIQMYIKRLQKFGTSSFYACAAREKLSNRKYIGTFTKKNVFWDKYRTIFDGAHVWNWIFSCKHWFAQSKFYEKCIVLLPVEKFKS